ncbi:GW domain-containing glycosaminoglycan-binding protein, partial [Listeria monocytogenes]
ATDNVWTAPFNTKNAEKLAPLADYNNEKLEIVTRAKAGNTLWYQFKVGGKLVGWASEKDLNVFYTPAKEEPVKQVAYVKDPTAKLYNKPVESTSTNPKAVGFYYGKLLAVDKTATILGEDWLHLKDSQNSLGWIKAIDINS